MPGCNRMGPMGGGPMTGRVRGICGPADAGYPGQFPGAAAFSRGMGRGRGFRWGLEPSMTPFGGRRFSRRQAFYFQGYPPEYNADEINILKKQAESLKNSLDAINRRMEELEKRND